MFVLKYNFNTVFINIYYNMLQCQKHSAQVKLKDISYKLFYLEDRYFPPPSAEKSELIQSTIL